MTTYAFDALQADPATALPVTAADTIVFSGGSANASSVIYNPTSGSGDTITVSFGGHSATFGSGLVDVAANHNLQFGDGSNLVIGGARDERLAGPDFGHSAVFGGAGNDIVTVHGIQNLAQGNQGDDSIVSDGGGDTIFGGQGDDLIEVGPGLGGLPRNDPGDFVQGNLGNDTIFGAETADTLLGGQGNDRIEGGELPGFLNGNLGDDFVRGAGQLFGEGGNDTLIATGAGADTLSGGVGNDVLTTGVAGMGADSLSGDAGDDTLNGSGFGQVLAGGPGADRFVFGAGGLTASLLPKILDWSGTEDSISFLNVPATATGLTTDSAPDFATAFADAHAVVTTTHVGVVAVQVGSDVIVFAGSQEGLFSAVDLVGRSLADISAHNLG